MNYIRVRVSEAEVSPLRTLCGNHFGLHIIKGDGGNSFDFICVEIIDPATGWFKMLIPTSDIISYNGKLTR